MTTKIVKPYRSTKMALKCNMCQTACSPKNGNWFNSPTSENQQVFLCAECEKKSLDTHRRAIPLK